tara:strand:+ start:590 stop:1432 length:843 start_codon:yes stop_codon:yes gene_type:complete
MKQTNLTVELVLVTPELAKNYLRFNQNNRTLKSSHVTFLSNQIKKDAFLENGEGIIFDNEGVLKDGQHRLKAISINDKSYFIPVIRGVNSHCMATYDTGKNRSSADILKLNGFKYPAPLAGFIQIMNKYCVKSSTSSAITSNRLESLTNQEVLTYVNDNYYWLIDIVSKTEALKGKVNKTVLSPSFISLITYMIGGKNPSNDVYQFIKHITGVLKTESSSMSYIYNKLYNSKVNKEPLNNYWVLGMIIKSWNFYADGNPAVKYFKFDVNNELPKVLKYSI